MAMKSFLNDRKSFVINNGIDENDFFCKKATGSNGEVTNELILYCGGKVLSGQSPAYERDGTIFYQLLKRFMKVTKK